MAVKVYSKYDNRRLTPNFRLGEFHCKCGKPECCVTELDEALVERLQQIRDHFGRSVNVNSGYRCEKHNAFVGGDPGSHHKKGMAADIRVEGILPEEVAKYAESIGIQRIGLYSDFVHIGSSPSKRFWLGHQGTLVDTHGGIRKVTVELPVLKQGTKGEAVRAMQKLLATCKADGSFGPATKADLLAYQQEQGLEPDASCGPETWASLLGVAT